jgi:hypothetical protein
MWIVVTEVGPHVISIGVNQSVHHQLENSKNPSKRKAMRTHLCLQHDPRPNDIYRLSHQTRYPTSYTSRQRRMYRRRLPIPLFTRKPASENLFEVFVQRKLGDGERDLRHIDLTHENLFSIPASGCQTHDLRL